MNFFLLKEYIKYFHLSTDLHSLHSPFFFDFYQDLVIQKNTPPFIQQIEKKRINLKNQNNKINFEDYGAGSKARTSSSYTSIAQIANTSLSSYKFSTFLYRLIKKYNSQTVIELGTSLGINTFYMSKALSSGKLITFEGDPTVMAVAKKVNEENFNITFIEGNIDQTLIPAIKSIDLIDIVYADANHTFDATIDYFNCIKPKLHDKSIYVIDDIHWSKGMKKAWEVLKHDKIVTASIDLFDAGLLFFDPDLNREHHILEF